MTDASQIDFKTLTFSAARDAVRIFFLPITKLCELALSWKQEPRENEVVIALEQVNQLRTEIEDRQAQLVNQLQAKIAELQAQLVAHQELVRRFQKDEEANLISVLEERFAKHSKEVADSQVAEKARLIEVLEARLTADKQAAAKSQSRLVAEFESRIRLMQRMYAPTKLDYSTSSTAAKSAPINRSGFGSRPNFGFIRPPAKRNEALKAKQEQPKYLVEQLPEGGYIIKLPTKGQVGLVYPTQEIALEHAQKFNLAARPNASKLFKTRYRKNDKS